jgi:tetratricopeptide (TPR) repeat protein
VQDARATFKPNQCRKQVTIDAPTKPADNAACPQLTAELMKRCPECNRVETDEALKFGRFGRLLRGRCLARIKKAEELDPLSLIIINNIAEIEIDRHDLNAAARDCQRAIDLDPSFWAAHQTVGIVMVKQGRYDEALTEAQKSVQLTNRWNASLALLGHVYAKQGRRNDAEAIIKELEKRYADRAADGRDLAIVYAGLDDKHKAFSWLDKAVADRSVILGFMKLEPLLETLRSDPRWNDVEHRAGVS